MSVKEQKRLVVVLEVERDRKDAYVMAVEMQLYEVKGNAVLGSIVQLSLECA